MAGLLDSDDCPPGTALNMFTIAVKHNYFTLASDIMSMSSELIEMKDREMISLLIDEKIEPLEVIQQLYKIKDQLDSKRYIVVVTHLANLLWKHAEAYEAVEEIMKEALKNLSGHSETSLRHLKITLAHAVYKQGRL